MAAQAEDAATVVAVEDTAAEAEAMVEVQVDAATVAAEAATVAAEEATVAEEVMEAEVMAAEATPGAPAIPFPA